MSKPCPNLGMSAYTCQVCRGLWVWALWHYLLDISWQKLQIRGVCRVRAECLLSVFKVVSSIPGRHMCFTKKDEIFEVCWIDNAVIWYLWISCEWFLHHTNSWRPKKRQTQNSWSSSPHSWMARHECLEPPWCSSSGCSCGTRINHRRTHSELKANIFLITSFPLYETSASLAYLDTCGCVRAVRCFKGLGCILVCLVFGDRFWLTCMLAPALLNDVSPGQKLWAFQAPEDSLCGPLFPIGCCC